MNTQGLPYLQCSTGPGSLSIIEAAAGTGKTYNIARIVARLIMEREDAHIENMVVVTFTRAAAAELKTRISELLSKLSQALDILSPTGKCDDELVCRALAEGLSPEDLKRRLHRAQLNFDQAPIGTIHGFAMRVLSENGFGSRLKIGFTINEKTGPLIAELCSDYFRSLLLKHGSSEEHELLTGECALSEGNVLAYVTSRMNSPGLKGGVPGAENPFTDVDDAIGAALAALREERLKPGKKKHSKEVTQCLAALVWAVCEDAAGAVSAKFDRLAEENSFLSQEGLILRLRKALTENPGLRNALQNKYAFGLIDEFQDTSVTQFDIFRSLFLENPRSTFIVVGDPRQAIYRFRYCDLATYLAAVKEMQKMKETQGREVTTYTMNVNRRSGARYIDALNAIFTPPGSFALAGLDMERQESTGSPVLWDAGKREVEHPVQVVYDSGKKQGLDSIFKRCAQDIADMLGSGYRIPPEKQGSKELPDRPLDPGDIAVLLNTSWEKGRLLQSYLQKLEIPAVVLKEGNVFSSPEAQELIRFLEGVLNPDDNPARLRALLTPLGDLEFTGMKQADKVAEGAAKLQKLLDNWRKHSFGTMYPLLCREFELYDRLNTPKDRRKIGKYNALADYLAEAEFTRKLTPDALFAELCRRAENASGDKEFPSPPETDRGAVIINSVCGSKGLCYPVVFLPDLFIGMTNRHTGSCRCHDGKEEFLAPPLNAALTEGLPGIRQMYQRGQDEEIQESLRQAYVAFTRARYFCRFYCGVSQLSDPNPNSPRTPPRNAATDWLFRRNGTVPESFSGLTGMMNSDQFSDEPVFPSEVGRNCAFAPRAHDSEAAAAAEEFRRPDRLVKLGFCRGFLSFSNLSDGDHGKKNSFSGENDDEDFPEDDEELREFQQIRGGTTFGSAIHKLLEHVDFGAEPEQLERAAVQSLKPFGFDDEKIGQLAGKMLWNTFHTPLPDGPDRTFCLCSIDPARKTSELEFLCEFDDRFSSSELFRTVSDYFAPRAPVTAFPAENEFFDRGFFNGSIDLFFKHGSRYFIVDWKTNLLKGRNAYSRDALAAVMGKSGYCLQYLIYTAALFKFLKRRLNIAPQEEESFYDECFGGVYYLFVRGMSPRRPGDGVFADRPPFDICKKMEGFIG